MPEGSDPGPEGAIIYSTHGYAPKAQDPGPGGQTFTLKRFMLQGSQSGAQGGTHVHQTKCTGLPCTRRNDNLDFVFHAPCLRSRLAGAAAGSPGRCREPGAGPKPGDQVQSVETGPHTGGQDLEAHTEKVHGPRPRWKPRSGPRGQTLTLKEAMTLGPAPGQGGKHLH